MQTPKLLNKESFYKAHKYFKNEHETKIVLPHIEVNESNINQINNFSDTLFTVGSELVALIEVCVWSLTILFPVLFATSLTDYYTIFDKKDEDSILNTLNKFIMVLVISICFLIAFIAQSFIALCPTIDQLIGKGDWNEYIEKGALHTNSWLNAYCDLFNRINPTNQQLNPILNLSDEEIQDEYLTNHSDEVNHNLSSIDRHFTYS